MKALALLLLLSAAALAAGPAQAFKLHNGSPVVSDSVNTNLPDTVLGTSSQPKPPTFGFGHECDPHHHRFPIGSTRPLGSNEVTAPCAD